MASTVSKSKKLGPHDRTPQTARRIGLSEGFPVSEARALGGAPTSPGDSAHGGGSAALPGSCRGCAVGFLKCLGTTQDVLGIVEDFQDYIDSLAGIAKDLSQGSKGWKDFRRAMLRALLAGHVVFNIGVSWSWPIQGPRSLQAQVSRTFVGGGVGGYLQQNCSACSGSLLLWRRVPGCPWISP